MIHRLEISDYILEKSGMQLLIHAIISTVV